MLQARMLQARMLQARMLGPAHLPQQRLSRGVLPIEREGQGQLVAQRRRGFFGRILHRRPQVGDRVGGARAAEQCLTQLDVRHDPRSEVAGRRRLLDARPQRRLLRCRCRGRRLRRRGALRGGRPASGRRRGRGGWAG